MWRIAVRRIELHSELPNNLGQVESNAAKGTVVRTISSVRTAFRNEQKNVGGIKCRQRQQLMFTYHRRGTLTSVCSRPGHS